ncbi:MAG: PQQ-binding-like beta-propeller repeat protein [Bacteroidota bacterium]|nr:PQQ-binding-like beta-propeller repeat protein [Bacteroidota bacterium]
MKYLLPVLLLSMVMSCQSGPEIFQFRGENRDGVYSEENLLKEWPEAGPEQLWSFEGLGNGYGSPTVTNDKIFVTGEIDSVALLFAFDLSGELLWKREYGLEWMLSFSGSRMAPTVVDDLVYVISGVGDMSCFSTDGDEIWSVGLLTDLNGKNNRFGLSQSPLVDGDLVFCAPGGQDTNFVALNRFSGEIAWIGKALGEFATHCSPRMIERGGRKVILTFCESSIIALDATDGELLWNMKMDTLGLIYPNTPYVEGDFLYSVSGAGNFGIKLKLNEDASDYELVWKNKSMDNLHGGFVKIDNYLVSNGYRKQYLKSIDVETGEMVDSLKTGRGSLIYADDLLYLYNYRGQMHLISFEQGHFELISKFKVKLGTREHFSHATIRNGVLYVRHGNALVAYGIAY